MNRLAIFAALSACVSSSPPDPIPTEPTVPRPIHIDDCHRFDCPYVGANTYPMYTDAVEQQIIPLALHGVYELGWTAYGAYAATFDTDAKLQRFEGSRVENPQAGDEGLQGSLHLRGNSAGVGRLTVTSYAPYHNTEVYSEDRMDLDILPVDSVKFDLPRYQPLNVPVAPVVVGDSVRFAVRLLAGNREVADITLVSDIGVRATWNTFVLHPVELGHHEVVVTADSLAQPATVRFEAIDHIDEIVTSDVRNPKPSYYHVVCAHAFAQGREVYTSWTMTAENANGWIPATAGNCLEVVPGPNIAVVRFTAVTGQTTQVNVAQ